MFNAGTPPKPVSWFGWSLGDVYSSHKPEVAYFSSTGSWKHRNRKSKGSRSKACGFSQAHCRLPVPIFPTSGSRKMAHFRLEVVTGNRKTVVAEEHPWSFVQIDSRVKELLRNTKWNASHPFLPANCPLREYHWHTQMGRLTPLAADCATDSLFWLTSECNKCLCKRKNIF